MIHPPTIPGACPFCEHVNPADSKFCNTCGGALHLAHCPRCGAVNDVTATACYQCRDPISNRSPDAPGSDQPSAHASKPQPLPKSRLAIGAAILVLISTLGYYGYSKSRLIDPAQPLAARKDASRPDNRTDSGVASREEAIRVTHTAKPDEKAVPVGSAIAKRETPVPGVTPAAAPVTRAKAAGTAKSGERGLPGGEACAEPLAALGLCRFKTEIARPQPVALRKSAGQESPRGQTCTTAAAALGLCTPQLTQEGK